MGSMEGRVALVTGASSGIGRAAAVRLARDGAAVVLFALPGAELEAALDECRSAGSNALATAGDVADPTAVERAFAAGEGLGGVDAVFNNAGISLVASIADTSDEQWERQLRTNLTGSFVVAREAARRLVARGGGAIVSTASELALMGQAGYAAYSATKGGVLAMTRALAAELATAGVRVNAVCPGATDTPLLAAEFATAPDPAAEVAETERSIAIGRLATAEEIARTVVFLLSDAAAYVTGAAWAVDGGRSSCLSVGTLSPEESR